MASVQVYMHSVENKQDCCQSSPHFFLPLPQVGGLQFSCFVSAVTFLKTNSKEHTREKTHQELMLSESLRGL